MTPARVLELLEIGRDKLGKANEDLKTLGRIYAEKRGEYKMRYSKIAYQEATRGETSAKAEQIAQGTLSNLRKEFESAKILWETQKRVCENIGIECTILQTIKNAMQEEWNQS